MEFDAHDVKEDAILSEDEHRDLLRYAHRDTAWPSKLRVWDAYIELVIVLAVVGVARFLGVSTFAATLVAIFGATLVLVRAVLRFEIRAYPMLIYLSDLTIKLHERQVDAAADLAERVATFRR